MPKLPDPLPERTSDTLVVRRVRRSMYVAFAFIAALALFEADASHRQEQQRAAASELVELVTGQSGLAAQIGRIAALAHDPAAGPGRQAGRLAEFIALSRAGSARVAPLLEAAGDAGPGAQPSPAVAAWQAANSRLLQRGDEWLARQRDGDASPADGAAALQDDADALFGSSNRLVAELTASARERSLSHLGRVDVAVAVLLLLLALLALAVVEPTVRAVRRQMRRIEDQHDELERLALVAARTDNLVVVAGADRRIEWVNDAFVRLSGYRADEVRGLRPGALLQAAAGAPIRHVLRALARGEGLRTELHCGARDGRSYWLDLDIQPLRDASGRLRGFVTVGTDISERRRLHEQLEQLSLTDALTGLPNRGAIVARVQRAIDHAARHPEYGFAVLFMDFDRFKQVNDTLGHAAGDELLRQIARRVVDTLRPGDAVARIASQLQTAARVGGDEFVVVLEGVRHDEDIAVIAERLLAVLAEPYTIEHHAVQSGVSIGIVASAHGALGARSADEVLRDADTAMYEAKRAGRGRYVIFDSSMHERVIQALEIESDLRRALREHELFVVYQPVVELGSGAMVGVEALVRWRHPTRGIVPPAQFIGVAEEVGLIDAIGQEVLQSACRQFARWRLELGEHAPRQLAVNLSRAQLTLPGLVPEVRWVLEENGMQPHELTLEITESLAAQDQRVQATLRELKDLGVKLALDDFGTGYSSLACLHQLPVDTVKIDRSFVVHAETVEYHRVLIEATIRVAQTLGMATVAEGIETEGQAELMARLHCDRGQGYLFARPLAADELARWALEVASVGA